MVDGSSAVILRIWDISGKEKHAGSRDDHYAKADAAIFVYDGTSHTTQRNLLCWMQDVFRVCGDVPSVVVRNKIDLFPQEGSPFRES